jgi:hypothetical protein
MAQTIALMAINNAIVNPAMATELLSLATSGVVVAG